MSGASTLFKVWMTVFAVLVSVLFGSFVYGMIWYPDLLARDAHDYAWFWTLIVSFVGIVLNAIIGGVVYVWREL